MSTYSLVFGARFCVGQSEAPTASAGPDRSLLGACLGEDGPSQMALEDLALFRAIPTATVFYPSDGVSTEKAVELAANTKVPMLSAVWRKLSAQSEWEKEGGGGFFPRARVHEGLSVVCSRVCVSSGQADQRTTSSTAAMRTSMLAKPRSAAPAAMLTSFLFTVSQRCDLSVSGRVQNQR